MSYRILVVNPGSTSTKGALYEDKTLLYETIVDHSMEDLERFDDILDQEEYRTETIQHMINQWGADPKTFSVIIGIGGLLPGMKAGGYLVNGAMINAIRSGKASPHASNLGALIADKIGNLLDIPAYIYDSVTADEFQEIAKITGMPSVTRESMCHVLNMKAVSRKIAEKYNTTYEKMHIIVAHMGGGVSISIHEKGKIIDAIRDDAGPFSPERTGGIPLLYIIDMCYSGQFTRKEMIKKIRGVGGMKAYLGTQDCREIERMIGSGNQQAKLIYEAQAYQIAKGIGEMAPVLSGELDCIILTGGMAHSKMMTDMIRKRVAFIAPVEIVPGGNEMEALAFGAVRILEGEPVRKYGE